MTYGVGIIGASRVSDGHAQAVAAVPETQLVAIAEPDAQRREAFAGKHACTVYAIHDDLLADPRVDVVMIGLPHFLHTVVTLAACEAGKHIFLEKPMAMTIADCDAIITAAEKAGVKLLVAHTEHFVPAGLAARRLIQGRTIRHRSFCHRYLVPHLRLGKPSALVLEPRGRWRRHVVHEWGPHARSPLLAHRQPDHGRAGLGEQSDGGPEY